MDNGSLIRGILDSLCYSLLLDVIDYFLLNHSWNILSLVLDGIVILDSPVYGYNLRSCHLIEFGDDLLDWDLLDPLNLIKLNVALLIRNVFNSTLGWDVLNYGFFIDGWGNGCGTHCYSAANP